MYSLQEFSAKKLEEKVFFITSVLEGLIDDTTKADSKIFIERKIRTISRYQDNPIDNKKLNTIYTYIYDEYEKDKLQNKKNELDNLESSHKKLLFIQHLEQQEQEDADSYLTQQLGEIS